MCHSQLLTSLGLTSQLRRTGILCCLLLAGVTAPLQAGDWPQILGPTRNGIAEQETLSLAWSAAGLKPKWSMPVGSGVAGVSVREGLVVLFHRVEDQEIAVGIDALTGEPRWSRAFPATFQPRIMPNDGPLCVPLQLPEKVLLHGAGGHLHCLNRQDGKLLWSVDTFQEFGTDEGYFGAGSSPLVVDQRVLLNVGGFRQEAGVVAFQLETGKQIWKVGKWQASYSSPVLTDIEEHPVAVFVTRLETIGLEPATGRVRFQLPFGMRGPTVNGANPIIKDGHLFLTASYGIGHVWAKMEPHKLTVLREGQEPLSSQYTTPIVLGNNLIGIDGRQDGGKVDLVCFDPATGEETWRKSDFGYATLIKAGDHLLVMKTDGELVVAAADAGQYTELKRVRLSNLTCRALPALAAGKLYLRDEQSLHCFELNPTP